MRNTGNLCCETPHTNIPRANNIRPAPKACLVFFRCIQIGHTPSMTGKENYTEVRFVHRGYACEKISDSTNLSIRTKRTFFMYCLHTTYSLDCGDLGTPIFCAPSVELTYANGSPSASKKARKNKIPDGDAGWRFRTPRRNNDKHPFVPTSLSSRGPLFNCDVTPCRTLRRPWVGSSPGLILAHDSCLPSRADGVAHAASPASPLRSRPSRQPAQAARTAFVVQVVVTAARVATVSLSSGAISCGDAAINGHASRRTARKRTGNV